MLYNYYMKKPILWLSAALVISCFSYRAFAQMTVVKVEGTKIYLDTSEEKNTPTQGSTFKVILSSETLTNPKTGKNLGEVYQYSPLGTITEVQPLYAIGELKDTKKIAVGQQAVLEVIKPAAVAEPAAVKQETPVSSRVKTVYKPIEQTVISLTEADVTAVGAKNIITLGENNQVWVLSRAADETLKTEMTYTLPADKKGLAVSAAPVKEGLAQIFVAVYATDRTKITTLVLENKNGTLENTDTLSYFVKELGCGADKKVWGQRPFVLGTAPGNASEIVFEKNKFATGGTTFNTRHNWLAGLNYYPVEKADADNLILTAANGELRMMLTNGKRAESKDLFGSTPLRMQYKQEILKFYPSLQAFGTPGQATLVAVENGTKLGLLSKTFGQYQNGKVHFLNYQKGRLQVTDTVELEGVLYDTTCTDTAILTAETLTDGTSAIVEILK